MSSPQTLSYIQGADGIADDDHNHGYHDDHDDPDDRDYHDDDLQIL